MRTFLYSLLLIAIVLAGITALAVYWTFVKSGPDYDDAVTSANVSNEVVVSRDQNGIPSITASDQDDAFFALGYVHAQDRLWQLTIQQIAIQGRFSEFFGQQAEALDRFSRMMNFKRRAENQLNELSASELQLLNAYTSGINHYIDKGPAYFPLEFSLTDTTPVKWEPVHVLAMLKLKAWNLSTAEAKLTSSLISGSLAPEHWQDLFPDAINTGSERITRINQEPAIKLLRQSRNFQESLGWSTSPSGSNVWVIPSGKSLSGYPILAADPHTALTIPSPWYETSLTIDGKNISGFTTPGIPVFFFGRNDHFSWAYTNAMTADTEFINLTDPESGEVSPDLLTTRREIIRIEDGQENMIELTDTPYGPVINSIYDELEPYDPVAMNWHGFQTNQDFSGWHNLAFAESHQEFEQSATRIHTTPLHLFYADRSGQTDHLITGEIPEYGHYEGIRTIGDANNQPSILAPPHRPEQTDSENGFLMNANEAFTLSNGYQPGHFFEPNARAERINYLLNEFDDQHNIATSRAMQQDITSHYAIRINNIILPILREYETDPEIEQALEYLENWNYSYTPSAAAATVFEQFLMEFGRTVFSRVLDDELLPVYLQHDMFAYKSILHILQNGSVLLDPALEDPEHPAETDIVESMRAAITSLSTDIGSQTFEWSWENVHQISFIPFSGSVIDNKLSQRPALSMVKQSLLERGPFTHGGHSTTINQGKYNLNQPFKMTHGTSFRFITDLGTDSYNAILSTGQSGNPLSSYYDDQIDSWKAGEYRTMQVGDTGNRHVQYIMRITPE